MKVLLIGAGGFVGSAVARRLASQGHEVIALARSPRPAVEGVQLAIGDRGNPAAVAALARQTGAQVAVDLIAMTLPASAPLISALAGVVGRYLLLSSGDVYRRYGALHRLEADADEGALSETAPLRTRRYPYRKDPRRPATDPEAWMDDYDKIPVEAALERRWGDAGVILRLPMVFGSGDRQRRFAWAARPMLAGDPVLALDPAWAAWRTSLGYVEDVAAAVALASVHPQARGVYNAGPAEAPDQETWARRVAAALRWRGDIVVTAPGAAPLSERLAGLDLSRHLVLDTSRIRRELGFAEPATADAALAATLADERARS